LVRIDRVGEPQREENLPESRLDHLIGTVESGKLADLVVVDGDPLEDVGVLVNRDRIHLVSREASRSQGWHWKRLCEGADANQNGSQARIYD
jgi:hypothetical protein